MSGGGASARTFKVSDLPAWLADRIEVLPSGCWRYRLRWSTGHGYSKCRHKGRGWLVHRLVWTLLVGWIKDQHVLDHAVCQWRGCCNPAHLEAVTVKTNTHRGTAHLYKKTKPDPPAPDVGNDDPPW